MPKDEFTGKGETTPNGKLMDSRQIQAELGVRRSTAEALIRRLPKVKIEGVRKIHIRRRDLERYLDERTVA